MSRIDVSQLNKIFYPDSIAVIGGSDQPGTIGNALMQNLLYGGYEGKVYPVNIKRDVVHGLKCYKSILEIPDQVDLAVIAIPAPAVPKVVEECGKKGVKGAVVISGGFKEIGPEGAERERKLVEAAKKYNMRIIGPNCLGVYNAYNKMDTIFNPSDRQAKPKPGHIAFLSQSGALGAAILDWASYLNIGMSIFVSYGNAADLTEVELMEYLLEDEKTKVIALYVEGISKGRKFIEVARKVVKQKPVVALKSGRSQRGAMAVASHTGSLAGRDEIITAVFKRAGVIRAYTLRELFTKSKVLTFYTSIPGKRIAIVTNGGGAGVLTTDAVEFSKLELAKLREETVSKLREGLPRMASALNPVDILGDAPAERYDFAIRCVLEDPNVDAVVVITLLQSPALDAPELVKKLEAIRREHTKPVVVCALGGEYTKRRMIELEKVGVPAFEEPEDAVGALEALYEYAKVKSSL